MNTLLLPGHTHVLPREIGILLPNNQRQYRTSHAPKECFLNNRMCRQEEAGVVPAPNAVERVDSFCTHMCFLEREFFIDNLLVRIHFIIVMIRWTGLAPWEFEFPFAARRRRASCLRPMRWSAWTRSREEGPSEEEEEGGAPPKIPETGGARASRRWGGGPLTRRSSRALSTSGCQRPSSSSLLLSSLELRDTKAYEP